jgi:hypothetical protein
MNVLAPNSIAPSRLREAQKCLSGPRAIKRNRLPELARLARAVVPGLRAAPCNAARHGRLRALKGDPSQGTPVETAAR